LEKSFTNRELKELVEALKDVTAQSVVMPPKIAYKIVKNKLAIEEALKPFNVSHDEIIKKLSGGKTSVEYKDNPQLFNEIGEAIAAIAAETVTVNISIININDLPDEALPVSVIAALEFMIEGA